MITGPIVLVEDDEDDAVIFSQVLTDLDIPNRLISFINPADAYHFLDNNEEQPFIIISDVNLPGMSGLEFKNKLDRNERLKKKSIPSIAPGGSAGVGGKACWMTQRVVFPASPSRPTTDIICGRGTAPRCWPRS